jgi:hypothetical protein
MTDNYIQTGKNYTLKIGIKDANGNDTGNYLEFDLMDVSYMLKLEEAQKQHKKNYNVYCNQMKNINKKENHKGKFILSSNQEETLKAELEFYEKEEKALDMFLGEGGTKKVLNGRKFNDFTFNLIMDEIAPIIPLLRKKQNEIINEIKEKYGNNKKEVLQ